MSTTTAMFLPSATKESKKGSSTSKSKKNGSLSKGTTKHKKKKPQKQIEQPFATSQTLQDEWPAITRTEPTQEADTKDEPRASRIKTPQSAKHTLARSDKKFLTPAKRSISRSGSPTRSMSPTYRQTLSYSEIRKGKGVEILKLKERILNSEEDEEESENAILIIKRQEIEAKIIDSDASISSDEEKKLIRKQILKEKFFDIAYTDLQTKFYREASPVREEVSKAKKPKFKLEPGKQYIERQLVTTHATEIIPRKKLHLIPLLERDEHLLSTEVDRKLFSDDERRIVYSRRKDYSNRGRGVIREILMTEVWKKKLEATVLIQRWFRRVSNMLKLRKATVVHKENIIDVGKLANDVKKLAEEEKEKEEEEKQQQERLEQLKAMQEAELIRKINFNDPLKRYSLMDPNIKSILSGRRASALAPIWARETKAWESKHNGVEEKKEPEPLFKLKTKTPSKRGSFRSMHSDDRSMSSSRHPNHTSEEVLAELKARSEERKENELLPIWAKETKASGSKRTSQFANDGTHELTKENVRKFEQSKKAHAPSKSDDEGDNKKAQSEGQASSKDESNGGEKKKKKGGKTKGNLNKRHTIGGEALELKGVQPVLVGHSGDGIIYKKKPHEQQGHSEPLPETKAAEKIVITTITKPVMITATEGIIEEDEVEDPDVDSEEDSSQESEEEEEEEVAALPAKHKDADRRESRAQSKATEEEQPQRTRKPTGYVKGEFKSKIGAKAHPTQSTQQHRESLKEEDEEEEEVEALPTKHGKADRRESHTQSKATEEEQPQRTRKPTGYVKGELKSKLGAKAHSTQPTQQHTQSQPKAVVEQPIIEETAEEIFESHRPSLHTTSTQAASKGTEKKVASSGPEKQRERSASTMQPQLSAKDAYLQTLRRATHQGAIDLQKSTPVKTTGTKDAIHVQETYAVKNEQPVEEKSVETKPVETKPVETKANKTKDSKATDSQARRHSESDKFQSLSAGVLNKQRAGSVMSQPLTSAPLVGLAKQKEGQNTNIGETQTLNKSPEALVYEKIQATIAKHKSDTGSRGSVTSNMSDVDSSRRSSTREDLKQQQQKKPQETRASVSQSKWQNTTASDKRYPAAEKPHKEVMKITEEIRSLLSAAKDLENAAAVIIQRYARGYLVRKKKNANSFQAIQKEFTQFVQDLRSDPSYQFSQAMQALALFYIKRQEKANKKK